MIIQSFALVFFTNIPFVFGLSVPSPSPTSSYPPVRNNGGNCFGIKSCRPRCMTFKIHRNYTIDDCGVKTGGFLNENVWNVDKFRVMNCNATDTCLNNRCGNETTLPDHLSIRIGEEMHLGPVTFDNKNKAKLGEKKYFYEIIDLPEYEDTFSFCSLHPCIGHECALPEQMGYELQLEIRDASPGNNSFSEIKAPKNNDFVSDSLSLAMEIFFKPHPSEIMSLESATMFGPLEVIWFDNPAGCSGYSLPTEDIPVNPLLNPTVLALNMDSAIGPIQQPGRANATLFCEGSEYKYSLTPFVGEYPSASPSFTPSSMTPSKPPSGIVSYVDVILMTAFEAFMDFFMNSSSSATPSVSSSSEGGGNTTGHTSEISLTIPMNTEMNSTQLGTFNNALSEFILRSATVGFPRGVVDTLNITSVITNQTLTSVFNPLRRNRYLRQNDDTGGDTFKILQTTSFVAGTFNTSDKAVTFDKVVKYGFESNSVGFFKSLQDSRFFNFSDAESLPNDLIVELNEEDGPPESKSWIGLCIIIGAAAVITVLCVFLQKRRQFVDENDVQSINLETIDPATRSIGVLNDNTMHKDDNN